MTPAAFRDMVASGDTRAWPHDPQRLRAVLAPRSQRVELADYQGVLEREIQADDDASRWLLPLAIETLLDPDTAPHWRSSDRQTLADDGRTVLLRRGDDRFDPPEGRMLPSLYRDVDSSERLAASSRGAVVLLITSLAGTAAVVGVAIWSWSSATTEMHGHIETLAAEAKP